MKVILLKDVKGTGKVNDIVEVSNGYGMNYLIKNNIAKAVTNSSLNENKQLKDSQAYHKEVERQEALKLKNILDGQTLTFSIKLGDNGKSFGSITSKEIADELLKRNINIDKKKIMLSSPLKCEGIYEIVAKIYPEISATFKVTIKSE
jgi:large subunit ribosomal protein L9